MGERKTRHQKALCILKKIAVGIVALDLISSIYESHHMGKFFLLLTMTSTFSVTPENVISNHCHQNDKGICESYQGILHSFPTFYKNADSFNPKPWNSKPSYPSHSLHELVMSLKSTFDPSRTAANISFYFDDNNTGGGSRTWHEENSPNLFHTTDQNEDKQRSKSPKKNHQSHPNSSNMHADFGSGSNLHSDSNTPTPTNRQNDIKPIERKKRSTLSTEDVGESSLSSPALYANTPQANFGKKEREAANGMRGGGSSMAGSDKSSDNNHLLSSSTSSPLSRAMPFDTFPPTPFLPAKWVSNSAQLEQSKRSSQWQWKREALMSTPLGPKKILGYIEEELFARWPFLVQKAFSFLRNLEKGSGGVNGSVAEQLRAPQARAITMHIEINPFGPEPLRESSMRLQTMQQILFDYPWAVVLELQNELSESFLKTFLWVSIYVWLWGSAIALMLLAGTLLENQYLLHAWALLHFLHTLLLYLTNYWIDSNFALFRSTASIWFFNLYTLYKPLEMIVALKQYYEIQEIAYAEIEEEEDNSQGVNCNCLRKQPRTKSPHCRAEQTAGTKGPTTILDMKTAPDASSLEKSRKGLVTVSTIFSGQSADEMNDTGLDEFEEDDDEEDDEDDETGDEEQN